MFRKLREEVEKVRGGLSDDMTVEKIAEKHGVGIRAIEMQIEKGKKVEMEHTDDPSEAERVAMDHLVEFPDYYDRLQKMEDEAKSEAEELNEAMLLLTESEKEVKKELDKAKRFFGGEKIEGIDTNRFVRIWNHMRDAFKMNLRVFVKLLNPLNWPKAIFMSYYDFLKGIATLGTRKNDNLNIEMANFMRDIGDGKYKGKSAKEMFADYNDIREKYGFKPYSYLQENVIRTDFNGVPNRDFDGNVIDSGVEEDLTKLNEAVATVAELLKKGRQIEMKIRTEKDPEKLRVLTQQLEAIKKVINDPNISNARISVKNKEVVEK